MKNIAIPSYGLGLVLSLVLFFSLAVPQAINAWEDDGYVYDDGGWSDDGYVYDNSGNWYDDGYVYDDGGWNDDGYVYDGDGCYDNCGDEYDGCYDYCGGDYDNDYCDDYCNDYDDDYCDNYCNDYDDDYCDYECESFYEETEDFYDSCNTCSRGSQGQMYSSSVPRSPASHSAQSFPMKFANAPFHAPVRQSPPIVIPNQPKPIFQPTPVSNNTIITNTNTNIDNSINDSFNDNSYNDYSVNGSFNTIDSNNTAVAIGGTWGTVTPIAAVTPGRTIAAAVQNYVSTKKYVSPITRANPQYVALSQIPYTGFDLGPIGNTIYWMSLASIAAAGAYLLVYFKGGALAFVGSFMPRSPHSVRGKEMRDEVSLPTLSSIASETKEIASGTKDTMRISAEGISIKRNF